MKNAGALLALVCMLTVNLQGQSFVNWETPHVHPLDITPDGNTLLAVNLPDNRLEVFSLVAGNPLHIGSVPVGLDPCSVRARTDTEVWVVNHISDSVSIVDLATLNVKATLTTLDEPADVIFGGAPERAFVSCSQANAVQVFDPASLSTAPTNIAIDAEDPRALAVNAGGTEVYVAVFESGNESTILGGGGSLGFPPNVVNDAAGPYGGTNPPPNDGANFNPPINGALPTPPAVGLIVKKDGAGQWMDDNGGNWTNLVSGASAASSGRVVGWDLPDRDVAIINTSTLAVTYATRLMNICMAIAVNPGNNQVTVVGTDGTNEIRFEPVITGTFTRVNIGLVDASGPTTLNVVDLNDDHLNYSSSSISQSERDRSLGDPRGVVWNSTGTRGYVSGMGSNNVIVIDAGGNRLNPIGAPGDDTIEVGEGPTGLALAEASNRLYVYNKFASSLSVIDTTTEQVINTVSIFDPSPTAIKTGRKHLYDTHKNSGLGQIACGSCHVDSRMDRLAWDLGNPTGSMKTFNQNCLAGFDTTCQDWHPMKGPMTTQTLQDIIGQEPHHWRGDKDGLEEFNGAFIDLQGDDVNLTAGEMQEYEDFLATIHFPPNPFRNFDNTLPTDLNLAALNQRNAGRYNTAGTLLPNGNAQNAVPNYRNGGLDGGLDCVTCHTLPTGMGTDRQGLLLIPVPPGPNGENHLSLTGLDGSTNVSMKVPHLRNGYEKAGFDTTQINNNAGFGFLHDGSVDSVVQFLEEPVFSLANEQELADMVAFMFAFSGSDLPAAPPADLTEPPGTASQDTHAAVGSQVTVDASNKTDAAVIDLITEMKNLADAGVVGLVAKGVQGGEQRGYEYIGADTFQSDRAAETVNIDTLRLAAAAGEEITFTVVPEGTQNRIGIDQDEDTFLDRDELDACSNPADAGSIPGGPPATPAGDLDNDSDVDANDFLTFSNCFNGSLNPPKPGCFNPKADIDKDGDVDANDFLTFSNCFNGSLNPANGGCPCDP